MLTHHQCEMARQATGTHDPDNEIKEQFAALSDNEKEKVAKELSILLEHNDFNLVRGIEQISANYFMTKPVMFCVFKEWQAKNK